MVASVELEVLLTNSLCGKAAHHQAPVNKKGTEYGHKMMFG